MPCGSVLGAALHLGALVAASHLRAQSHGSMAHGDSVSAADLHLGALVAASHLRAQSHGSMAHGDSVSAADLHLGAQSLWQICT